MNKYRSSAELKTLAKDKLIGKYPIAIIAMVIVTGLPYLITSLIPTEGYVWTILSFAVSIIVSVIVGVMQIGLNFMFLNMACDQPFSSTDIYYGFHNNPDKSVQISIVQAAVSIIPMLPYQIFMLIYLNTHDMTWYAFTMLFMALGLVIYVPLSLAISQSYYLLLDFPDYSAKQILQTSCKIMKGHMGRLFYIQASFIPLMILGCLSCMIGLLWVMPYMQMTLTLFFLDLMNPQKKDFE
ncbi:MAG: DUF975 family protein [Lachnospiraceae bacterium]|nr:DUF975 family protein [Lachnospiraceae bacterium]